MKKPSLVIALLVFSIVALGIIRIYIANSVATSGIILVKMEESINHYKLENTKLSEKVYTLSSLTYINSKARELGYVDNRISFVLSSQQPVAFKQ